MIKNDLLLINPEKKVRNYLEEQRNKYLKIYNDNDVLKSDNFSKSCFEVNFHSSKSSKLMILKKASQDLKEYFNEPNGNFNPNYGLTVLNNMVYFYIMDTNEQEKIRKNDSEEKGKSEVDHSNTSYSASK